ncbi:MAG: redoxin domain-containing protein [Pseudomonadota bacterium]
MTTTKLHAGDPFPNLTALDDAGTTINISTPTGDADWQLLVVYRGRHCPLCTKFLNALSNYRERLTAIGIDIAAVSADSQAQLDAHRTELDVNFPLFHGLTLEQMQSLGLYISIPRSEQETDHNFAEPGLFVINSDGRLQVVDISNNPFARPDLEILVSGLEWIRAPENSYPVRGTFSSAA